MSDIFYYRLYCSTEDKLVYYWGESPPLHCPNNSQHNIDNSSITILDSRSQQNINIIQIPAGLTNENYRAEGQSITILPQSIFTKDYSWPYNIGIMNINLLSEIQNEGDIINGYVAPNTIIGYIINNINQGDTTFNVNSSVVQYLKIGHLITISDGVQVINIGECIAIDNVNNTFSTLIPSPISLSLGSYVQMTIHNLINLYLGKDSIMLANKNLGASVIPKGIVARISYTNNSNISKTFKFMYEYLY